MSTFTQSEDKVDGDVGDAESDGESTSQTTTETAGKAPVDRYPALAEADVKADPDLTAAERQTSIQFTDADDRASVYSENGAVMRALLEHPEYDLRELRVSDEDRFGARCSPRSYENDGGTITGVDGYIPIGLVKLLARSRRKDWPSLIVSDAANKTGDREGSS